MSRETTTNAEANEYNKTVDHPVTLVLEEGVEAIESQAFYGCSMFTSVSIPSTVTEIGTYAFYGCDGLTYTLYDGNENTWSSVIIGSGNENLLNALLYYRTPDFVLPAALTSIEEEAFSGIGAVSALLPDTVTAIGDRAFADCETLRQVIIPDSVTTIGETAFEGCGPLLIVGGLGSTAEEYAAENGFAFMERPAA